MPNSILYLKFIVDNGKTNRLVMSPALINNVGLYKDALYVYTEDGKFELRSIVGGAIEHVFIDET